MAVTEQISSQHSSNLKSKLIRLQKFLCLILLLFFSFLLEAQHEEDNIKDVITLFFDGLQNGDTIKIKETISDKLILQTTYINDEKSVLKNENVSAFLNSVASKKREDIWEEKLVSVHINIDDNMANVWTPYEFYLNNKFSHCGVNSFQLFNDGVKWRIIYLIDTRRKQDCKK